MFIIGDVARHGHVSVWPIATGIQDALTAALRCVGLEGIMSLTVPPEPVDIAERFPALTPYARSVTLLYPRLGTPGREDSSLGGPLLRPAGEAWPTCAAADHYNPARDCVVVGPAPVAMVPVLQLFARHVPALVFPPGTDALQVLWCPQPDGHTATPSHVARFLDRSHIGGHQRGPHFA
ncbi:hypothetical protein ACFV98_35890 [Streptomyces violascens]|uniref:hypothetical protein n=1 Tax=Streptomyces violascens TaxID=67381 RepID=UPI0036473755